MRRTEAICLISRSSTASGSPTPARPAPQAMDLSGTHRTRSRVAARLARAATRPGVDLLGRRPGRAVSHAVLARRPGELHLLSSRRTLRECRGKITQLSLGQPTPAFRPACVSQRLRRFHYLFSRSDLLHGWEKGHDWINIKDVPSSLSFLSPAISCTIYRELRAIDELGEMLRKSPREGLAQMGRQARGDQRRCTIPIGSEGPVQGRSSSVTRASSVAAQS